MRQEPHFGPPHPAPAPPSPASLPPAPAPPEPPRRRRSWTRRLAWFCLRWTLVGAIWAAVALGAVAGYYAYQLPPIDNLTDQSRRPGVTVLAADGTVLASYGDLYGEPVTVASLPPYVWQAVVAIEDRRFLHHFGIDPIGLVRAAWRNRAAGRVVQGGSTLTQQVAKNIFLTPERTIRRKVQEVLLALWLEHRFTKAQILDIYLNRVYYGAGAYGIDAAAQRYFAKPARTLTLTEAAVLAGMLRAPTHYSPLRDPVRAAQRAAVVLDSMVAAGFVTAAEADAARRPAMPAAPAATDRPGRYFSDWVLDQLPGYVNVADRDIVVATTLDTRLQRIAESETAAILAADGAKKHAGQSATVVLARDGAVRAMVGGRDHSASVFNRAVLAQRQPGSAFKLFVYLAALEHGLTPDSMAVDEPVSFAGWSPRNFERDFRGPVSLADAFAYSLNTVSARLTAEVGARRVAAMARRMGLTTPIGSDLSIALGTSAATLIDMTAAYAAVAAGGEGVLPYGIAEIRDRKGAVLWRRTGFGPGPAIAPEIAAEAERLLAGVIRYGTGKAAALAVPAYGKTGTTQDSRDAWFLGFAGGLTAGVWFGNDDDTPMDKVVGGDLPARLWQKIMTAAVVTQAAAP